MSESKITVAGFESINAEGEVKPFLMIQGHPKHEDASLLCKYRPGTDERMDTEEMVAWLGENKGWRDQLGWAEGEYGPYFFVRGAKKVANYDV